MPDRTIECRYNDPPSAVAAPRSVTAAITGATQANPCVITAVGHGFQNGDAVALAGLGGMVELNNFAAPAIANATANTFELAGVNSTGFTPYTSGGTATKLQAVGANADVRVLYKDTLPDERIVDALQRIREAFIEQGSRR